MKINEMLCRLVICVCAMLGLLWAPAVASEGFVLVGSTPGDEAIKQMLGIRTDEKIDFMRWNLTLDEQQKAFRLMVSYGEIVPNSMNMREGGKIRVLKGVFTMKNEQGPSSHREIIQLKAETSEELSMVKLTENVFHVLSRQGRLMVGNGGWSYSLNRQIPVSTEAIYLTSAVTNIDATQEIFDGRTPCQEIAAEHPEMNPSAACFKLKWRLILNRDPLTQQPSTYTIRKVIDGKARDVSGRWSITRGIANRPDAWVYNIEAEHPQESISFLVADENVLFFLDKNKMPYVGNENFSFALNKRL